MSYGQYNGRDMTTHTSCKVIKELGILPRVLDNFNIELNTARRNGSPVEALVKLSYSHHYINTGIEDGQDVPDEGKVRGARSGSSSRFSLPAFWVVGEPFVIGVM